MAAERPILAITMGDICGIGPEITVKALMQEAVYQQCRPLIVGDIDMVARAAEAVGAGTLRIYGVGNARAATYAYGALAVWNVPLSIKENIPYAQVTAIGGRSAYTAVEEAIALAMRHEVDATVTGPLNKEALNLAGYHFSGHTEIYAALTHTDSYAMMLTDGPLRVVHVSTHVSLREACDRVVKERVLEVIRLANEACRDMGIANPRIAVAGLNPHCGENGLFGREEITQIGPAVILARAEGLNVTGPVPPDTVFSKAIGHMFDIVVAMYHDQGHIPLKVLGFTYDDREGKWSSVKGVNITLGLPIIRTSVDHGTAFEIAGTGTASEASMLNAISTAAVMAQARITREKES